MDLALLILRVVLGTYMFAHGAQKLLGWFGGGGLKGTEGFLGASLGFRPAWFWARMSALSETGGGLLVLLGFLNPLGSLGVVAAMLTAIFSVHWVKGPWNTNGGYELNVFYLAIAVAVAVAGPGKYSLDAALGISLPEPWTALLVTAAVLLGVIVSLAGRKPAPAK